LIVGKRALKKEEEVLNSIELNITKNFSIKKGNTKYQKENNEILQSNTLNNKIGVLGYYYKDKTDIQEIDYGVFYENNNLYLDIKKWKLWKNDNNRDGKYLTLHYKKNRLELGIELGKYEDYSYLYPYLEYKSNWNILAYQSITGKDMKSFCAVDTHLSTYHLIVSKYKGIVSNYNKSLTDKWYSFEISNILANFAFTPQFSYRFDKKNIFKDIEFYYYASGWYQMNLMENDCYYSPNLADSTFLEIHPIYKKLELIGKIGYSIKGNSFLYSYGFDFQNKWLSLGCMKNFSYKDSINNYWYEECHLKAGVKW